MDVGVVGRSSWSGDLRGGDDQGDGVDPFGFKGKSKGKCKGDGYDAGRLDTIQGYALTSPMARARARDSKENATIAVRKSTPHGNAR